MPRALLIRIDMIWEKQPDESARWYARFEVYRLLGPQRSLTETLRQVAKKEGLRGQKPGTMWFTIAKQWNWKERAQAWDEHERDRLRAQEENRRFDAREQRLHMIDEMLDAVFHVLQQCRMDELTPDLARAWLPTMRIMFKDLLQAQRSELGLPSVSEDTGSPSHTVGRGADEVLPFSAEEIAKAQAQLQQWRADNHAQRTLKQHTDLRNCLAGIYTNEASARRIADQAGLDLSHIAFGPLALNNWHAILTEAEHAGLLDALLYVVRQEYPHNPDLTACLQSEPPVERSVLPETNRRFVT